MLNMTQPNLAKAANVGLSTIVDFERERRPVSQKSTDALRSALEAAGVIFIAENGEGPGVRLKKNFAAEPED
ncbi:XRE family transcriptional regulator [Microvirga antarctica]|uniref:XRE family transcriptional regulator n=1 Tax=Microvirga antarctica TaxID=2819233 RepID=UPI0031BA07F3